jgi:hypothetical protein
MNCSDAAAIQEIQSEQCREERGSRSGRTASLIFSCSARRNGREPAFVGPRLVSDSPDGGAAVLAGRSSRPVLRNQAANDKQVSFARARGPWAGQRRHVRPADWCCRSAHSLGRDARRLINKRLATAATVQHIGIDGGGTRLARSALRWVSDYRAPLSCPSATGRAGIRRARRRVAAAPMASGRLFAMQIRRGARPKRPVAPDGRCSIRADISRAGKRDKSINLVR